MLLRLVKLAASEIRRGRHGITLRVLLSKPDEAKLFMFHFIRKRTNLAVKFQYMTWDQQSAERADRFRACLTASGAPDLAGVTLQPVSAGKMKARIARFFVEEIDPTDWENVKEAVKTIIDRPSPAKTTERQPESLEELFQMSRPNRDTEDAPDLINFAAEWLQEFVLAAGGSRSQMQDLVVGGWALALNH